MALDEAHLVAAARYVALNPVRAKLVARAQEHSVFRRSGNRFAAENASKENWAWSSARAHLAGRDDGLVRVAPLIERVGRFAELLGMETDLALFAALRDAESTGRPLGSVAFVAELEQLTGRRLQRRAAGRKATERTQQLELGIGEIGKVSP